MARYATIAASAALCLGLAACGGIPGRGALPPSPIQAAPAGSTAGAAPAGGGAPTTVGSIGDGLAVNGTVAGTPVVAKAALASATADAAGSPALLVMVSDQANACGLLSASTARQGSSYLLIALGAGGQPPGAGLYTVADPAHEAAVQLHRLDASCREALDAGAGTATAGTVQVDAVTADGGVTGRFDVVIGAQGDRLAGTFQAGGCAPLTAFIDPSSPAATATTCK